MNNATEHSLVLIDEFGKGTNSVRCEGKEAKEGMEEDEGREQETELREGRGLVDRGEGKPGRVQTQTLVLPSHLCPLTGGRSGTSGCGAPSLASTGTQLPSRLCGHQLPEPCSAAAAATRSPGAVFGEEVTLTMAFPSSQSQGTEGTLSLFALFEDHGDL